MDITLNDAEFVEAVTCYLSNKGFDVSTYDIDVRVVQGRNGQGNRAEVSMTDLRHMSMDKHPQNVAIDEEDLPPFDLEADGIDFAASATVSDEANETVILADKPAFGKLFGNKEDA